MRMTASTLWAAVLICLVAAPLAAQDDRAGARLVVEEKILDVGTVAKGEIVEANFRLTNEGAEPLVVKAVRPTCGCTVADFDREVPAGGEGWINAKLDTADFSGPVSKSILVMTSDPRDPTVTLVIKANVKPYIDVLPRPLIRFNAVKHEDMVQKVVVTATDADTEFEITEVDSSVQFLEPSVRRLDAEEQLKDRPATQYEIAVSLRDDAPVGPVSAQLTLHTDHPKAKEVPIKVYGVVRALIHVTPPTIQFGTVQAKDKPGRNVIVVSNRSDGEPTEISLESIDDPAFVSEIRPIEEGRRYQVTITIDPGAEPGVRDATLTLKTSDPVYPELRVPVRANIR